MNKNCEFAGGGYCLCSACQSMRKTLEELENIKSDEMMDAKEIKKLFDEADKFLKGCDKFE